VIANEDCGSITIVMMAVLAIGGSLAVRLGDRAHSLVGSARAQAVADATALSGVVGSRAESERVALENGAVLVRYEETSESSDLGSTVHVTIELEGRRADAWASDEG
jgi:hypothetical protein